MAVVRAYKSSKHTIHGYETTRTAYNVQCIHTGCERSTKTKQTNNQPNTSVTYCGDADICCCFFIFYQPHRLMYLAYMWSSSFFPLPIICCWCALFSGFGFQSCNALIKYSIDEEMGIQYFEAQIIMLWSTEAPVVCLSLICIPITEYFANVVQLRAALDSLDLWMCAIAICLCGACANTVVGHSQLVMFVIFAKCNERRTDQWRVLW